MHDKTQIIDAQYIPPGPDDPALEAVFQLLWESEQRSTHHNQPGMASPKGQP